MHVLDNIMQMLSVDNCNYCFYTTYNKVSIFNVNLLNNQLNLKKAI